MNARIYINTSSISNDSKRVGLVAIIHFETHKDESNESYIEQSIHNFTILLSYFF